MTFEEFKTDFDSRMASMSNEDLRAALARAGVKLTPDQQRYDDIHAPRCVCCERPFGPDLPKAGELTFMGQHGDGCKDCIDAMKENE